VTQHNGLDPERWTRFGIERQILMIANEMNRVSAAIASGRVDAYRRGYERVLRLTDLTVTGRMRPAFRRELLRWRELAAELYANETGDATRHREAFRALLRLTPASAKQVSLLAATRA
jgi:hypothetical protein